MKSLPRIVPFARISLLAALALHGSISTSSQAADIVIDNSGFETPSGLSPGQYVNDIPGWVRSEINGFDAGVVRATGSPEYPNGAPEGVNVAALSRSGRIDQTLDAFLEEGRYKLSMEVGYPVGYLMSPYTAKLLAGGNVLAESTLAATSAGEFETLSFDFVANGSNPLLGAPLGVAIDLSGPTDITYQFAADDVRLEFLSGIIPEPFTISLLLIASGFLMSTTRRQRIAVSERLPLEMKSG